jgi:hypothetical protein
VVVVVFSLFGELRGIVVRLWTDCGLGICVRIGRPAVGFVNLVWR